MNPDNPAAVALGKLAKGKPKHFSAAEIERRTKILQKINAKRKKAKKAKAH